MENILRRILLTSFTAPREALYIETGTISMEYKAKEIESYTKGNSKIKKRAYKKQ